MQQTQQNYRYLGLGFLILAMLATALPSAAAPATASDPLLTEAQGPCDPRLDGPDYVPGTDADGHPVAPADMDQGKFLVPDGALVPLGGKSRGKGRGDEFEAYVALNHDQLDSILNPRPACPSPRQKAHSGGDQNANHTPSRQ